MDVPEELTVLNEHCRWRGTSARETLRCVRTGGTMRWRFPSTPTSRPPSGATLMSSCTVSWALLWSAALQSTGSGRLVIPLALQAPA